MAALMLAVMAQVMLAGTSHFASASTGAAEVLSNQRTCPHMPTTCCGQMVLRSLHTFTHCRSLGGGAVGSRCLPSWSDGNAWQAPPWRTELAHILCDSTTAAASACEPTAARTSLLPVLSACALTWSERALLLCVGLLQLGGVAEQRRRGSAQSLTAGRPPNSKQERLKTAAMSHAAVIDRMVLCSCVSDL
jgi:hypothetical protein